jgi:hypothetical protein
LILRQQFPSNPAHPSSLTSIIHLNSKTIMALETFHLFYSFPLELRLKIWMFSLPDRTIRVHLFKAHGSEIPDLPREPLPSPFHVCQQSRVEMDMLYHPLSSSVFQTAPGELVNLAIDSIFCDDRMFSFAYEAEDSRESGISQRWKDTTTEEYYAGLAPLSLFALDEGLASSVTSLVLPAVDLKAIETKSEIETLDEMKANNRMSRHMISALKKFPALRELKILLNQSIDFQLPGVSTFEGGELKPVCLCDVSNRCYDCCKLMPGLELVDDWTWRVQSKSGGKWKGPAISFVCYGNFQSNCWQEDHP